MSYSKPTSLAKLNDAVLGCFSNVPPSEFINHLVRYLGTWSGSDKLFMILEYFLKLVIPLLNLRARVQQRAGLRNTSTSDAAQRCAKFASAISDSRMLWRLWGLLPIIQWMISLERNPRPTLKLLNIERLQGWSMLGYYPLEHLSYLLSHQVIPTKPTIDVSPFFTKAKTLDLDAGRMGMWSCRFWAVYVALQFAHLREDRKLHLARQRTLRKGASITAAEKQELKQRWSAFWNDVIINSANFPLALHWSTSKGLIKSEVLVSALNLIVAIVSFKSGWEATALPSAPAAESVDVVEPLNPTANATGVDVDRSD